jgi:hypothetical protein
VVFPEDVVVKCVLAVAMMVGEELPLILGFRKMRVCGGMDYL